MADLVEQAKKLASYNAVDTHLTQDVKVLGIGSGSTVVYCVERITQLHKQGKLPNLVACIPSSFQARQLILEGGLPLSELNAHPTIDLAFDGADEIDPSLNCIKGGGGCHLQEKLVAASAKTFILVADYRKESRILGSAWKKGVPIEVHPMAYIPVSEKLKSLGGKPVLRMAVKKAGPVVTDSGNLILDVDFGEIQNPRALNEKLLGIVGILETGLFVGMAKSAYLGCEDGSVRTLSV
ncbi:hypothetical protein HDV05_000307 [Chytridiales sp. JEL 0842]|nr:hypothetical protein HDV05_000307 [Chytridiales sp. JEL 0842]